MNRLVETRAMEDDLSVGDHPETVLEPDHRSAVSSQGVAEEAVRAFIATDGTRKAMRNPNGAAKARQSQRCGQVHDREVGLGRLQDRIIVLRVHRCGKCERGSKGKQQSKEASHRFSSGKGRPGGVDTHY